MRFQSHTRDILCGIDWRTKDCTTMNPGLQHWLLALCPLSYLLYLPTTLSVIKEGALVANENQYFHWRIMEVWPKEAINVICGAREHYVSEIGDREVAPNKSPVIANIKARSKTKQTLTNYKT